MIRKGVHCQTSTATKVRNARISVGQDACWCDPQVAQPYADDSKIWIEIESGRQSDDDRRKDHRNQQNRHQPLQPFVVGEQNRETETEDNSSGMEISRNQSVRRTL